MSRTVRRAPESSRYELVEDGAVIGVADYREQGDVVVLPHTLIDPSRQGGGLCAELVGAVLDDLRSRGRQVVPACWYVREFIDQHPDYADLVAG
ncbi:MAG: GNAT family N-acetyltransferase [Acidimicrobiia bacterium]